MKRIIVILLIACYSAILPIRAQDSVRVFQGCSGGMYLHTGYLFGKEPLAPRTPDGILCSPSGVAFGLGGAARVNLWKYLRIGGEGYVSTLHSELSDMKNVLQKGSYVRYGWGGLVADACWRFEKWKPYIGAGFGGGVMRGLYILSGDEQDWLAENQAVFHKSSFLYCNPYIGVDYSITQRIHLTFKFDWMVAMHKKTLVLPSGPRFYVGIMFCH